MELLPTRNDSITTAVAILLVPRPRRLVEQQSSVQQSLCRQHLHITRTHHQHLQTVARLGVEEEQKHWRLEMKRPRRDNIEGLELRRSKGWASELEGIWERFVE